MKNKNDYLKILGLTSDASNKDIRKAYRTLAMHFHPDINKSKGAEEKFILIKEAYDFLINSPKETNKNRAKREYKTKEEREKEAKIRFKKQQERQYKEQNEYYHKMTSGKVWNIFKIYCFLSLFIALILFAEKFLPKIYEKHTIIAKTEQYNGLVNGQVIGIKTNKELKIYIKNINPSQITENPDIFVESSLIFHNPYSIIFEEFSRKKIKVDFSAVNLYPIVPLLFCIPFATYYFKRKSYWFTFSYLLSKYIISVILLYFLLSQNRWLHLLTLGFI